MKPFMVALDDKGELHIERKPSLLAIASEGLRSALWVLVHGYEPTNQNAMTRDRH